MEWTELLQKAINYMEAHLLEDVNYEDVAHYLHMLNYNFHRTFSFMAGMTANEYIRNRRLSLAGQELQESNAKVIDVALKFGYDTPESFTKAFTRFHGVAPKYAKQRGTELCLFNPLVIKISMEGGKSMDYRIEEAEKLVFLALVRAFRNESINEQGNREIPDFWTECHKNNLVEPLRELRPEGKKDLFGLGTPTKNGESTFDYGIGIKLDQDTKPFKEETVRTNGYKFWEVPACTYVVLKCFGQDGDCISQMWSRFYKEFLPQTGYEMMDACDFEIYPEQGEPGLFAELWIPIRKKA
ncbi:MAG: AraC family transcriptional regulator [bacterium]|nr:AraC family transcriptional regulator [bacterium]